MSRKRSYLVGWILFEIIEFRLCYLFYGAIQVLRTAVSNFPEKSVANIISITREVDVCQISTKKVLRDIE